MNQPKSFTAAGDQDIGVENPALVSVTVDMLTQASPLTAELTLLRAATWACTMAGVPAPVMIMALDEVGRGCLAGPVTCTLSLWCHLPEIGEDLAALLAEQDNILIKVKDSKALSEKARQSLFVRLTAFAAKLGGGPDLDSSGGSDAPAHSGEGRKPPLRPHAHILTPEALKAAYDALASCPGAAGSLVANAALFDLPADRTPAQRILRYGETTAFDRPYIEGWADGAGLKGSTAAEPKPGSTLDNRGTGGSQLTGFRRSDPRASKTASEREHYGNAEPRGQQVPTGVISPPELVGVLGTSDAPGGTGPREGLLLAGLFTASASAQEIDELGIWVATNLAMSRAMLYATHYSVSVLGYASAADVGAASLVVVDGDRELQLPPSFHPAAQAVVIKGDARLKTVGAAAIVAKVARDSLMEELDLAFPGYGLAQHSGYGTKQHYAALSLLRASPIHRKSFRLY